ncbi:MAG: hypothetical protein MJ089_04830 [Ruminococcus sp.]|nr:hypothetical protein [Ruminococcus sp.]
MIKNLKISFNGLFDVIKNNYYIFGIAFIHMLITCYTDRFIFNFQRSEKLCSYILLKIILFIVIFLIWKWITLLSNGHKRLKNITLYAFPYMIVLIAYACLKNKYTLFGDELRIFNESVQLNAFPYHFMYFTGIIYIISLMLVPGQMGVLFVKIILQSLLCGYIIDKAVYHFKSKAGYLIYGLFVLPPVIENGILIHRMQFYGLLFLFLVVKMYFDYIKNKMINFPYLIMIMISFASLTFWRKEGIYLIVFAPLLIIVTYRFREIKKIISLFLVFFVIVTALYLPEICFDKNNGKEDTMTYVSWFVNMCRLGLDKDKYIDEIELVDNYISIEKIDYINEKLGNQNYEDTYIIWLDEYIGVREDYTQPDKENFNKAVLKIVCNEPLLFIKERFGMWQYTASKDGVIGVFYNLNVVLGVLLILLIYSIIQKNMFWGTVSIGLIINTGITLIFSPAAYFKYYYHTYLIGWFIIFLLLIKICTKIHTHFCTK